MIHYNKKMTEINRGGNHDTLQQKDGKSTGVANHDTLQQKDDRNQPGWRFVISSIAIFDEIDNG
jgi:hypothetical protein